MTILLVTDYSVPNAILPTDYRIIHFHQLILPTFEHLQTIHTVTHHYQNT